MRYFANAIGLLSVKMRVLLCWRCCLETAQTNDKADWFVSKERNYSTTSCPFVLFLSVWIDVSMPDSPWPALPKLNTQPFHFSLIWLF